MKKGVQLFGKTILFTAILSMGFMVNNADAQGGGRGGARDGGGANRGGGNGGGGRNFGSGNQGGNGGRNFGGSNQGGRIFTPGGDRGAFNRGNNNVPNRNTTPNRNMERRPEQITNRRPQQIVGSGRTTYNGNRGSIGNRYSSGPNRNYVYNSRRPVQVRNNYGRPNVHVNIGIGTGYRYNPRFYYGGGYHYRPYYYRPFYAPTFGVRLNVLPFGYHSFYYGATPYYFYDGAYYRQYNNYYEVVEPPLGAKLPTLPAGAEAVLIDGVTYYEYKGTYYQKTFGDNGDTLYEVVGTDGVLETDKAVQNEMQEVQQNGDVFHQLPEGTKPLQLDGKTYYVSPGGDYYEQFVDKNDEVYYVKVGTEG
jgi:hypothetical protein